MHSNIFFDFRPVYGDQALASELKNFIFEQVEANRLFLSFLARNAVRNPPPLSFFRNMVVERSGEHEDAFDIKARAMTPLADAARVLVYDFGINIYGSTAERWAGHRRNQRQPRASRGRSGDGIRDPDANSSDRGPQPRHAPAATCTSRSSTSSSGRRFETPFRWSKTFS